MQDMSAVRRSSWAAVESLGYPVNPALPLLDRTAICRTKDIVVDRVFAMLAAAAGAYGFDRARARGWLEREGATGMLTEKEAAFLNGMPTNPRWLIEQIEALWALCWCLMIVPDFPLTEPCAGDFVKLLPDLKTNETGRHFKGKARLRTLEEFTVKFDSLYCLHWSIVHTELVGSTKGVIKPFVVRERRRALEWVLSSESWDNIALDT